MNKNYLWIKTNVNVFLIIQFYWLIGFKRIHCILSEIDFLLAKLEKFLLKVHYIYEGSIKLTHSLIQNKLMNNIDNIHFIRIHLKDWMKYFREQNCKIYTSFLILTTVCCYWNVVSYSEKETMNLILILNYWSL